MQGRKMIWLIAAMTLLLCCLSACSGKTDSAHDAPTDEKTGADTTWEALETVKAAALDEIRSIRFTISTEGGAAGDEITDADTIREVYDLLCDLSLGEKTNMAVDDAGLYIEVLIGDEKVTFDFELDILVLNGETRYEVNGLAPLRRYFQSMLPEA